MANSVNVQKKVEIFSGPQCNYCNQAKALLDEIGIDYIELDISDDKHRDEFAHRLPRIRSIPQIFVDEQHIGGFEDLQILKEKGQLEGVLKGV
ncbi:MAG: glutaredoxin 3 [Gammaproteobacteria bacterium]|nr:glutaredoxin 3 [Gammaproteobacteria bacterium]